MLKAAGLALLALGLVACAENRTSLSTPNKEWGDTFLLVIDVGEGRRHPEKVYYPPECQEEGAICLGGSFIQHPAEYVATLAGSEGALRPPAAFEIQRPGPHAASGASAGRMVAFAERTDGGYWWVPWSDYITGREACVPENLLDHFGIDLSQQPYRVDGGSVCVRY